MAKDLRYFLQSVERASPRDLVRIKREVDPKWELSSVQMKLQSEGKIPILLFEKIRENAMRVVTNVAASRHHFALALDTTPREVTRRFLDAQKNRKKPVHVSSGPVKDVKLTGAMADLRKLPIITHCEKDAGPYLTAGVMITKDPSTGIYNAGIYRNMHLGPKSMTANFAPLSHASQICARAEAEGKDVEAAIVLGHHPAMVMASQYRGSLGEYEFDVMGGLLGEPVRMVSAESVDIMVPADAEIVIEGRIKPNLREIDGPFADYWLYYAPGKKARVFEVTAITHRNDAIMQDILNVGPEHIALFTLGIEGHILTHLQQVVPQVKSINIPASGVGNLIYIQINKEYEGLGVNTALAALGIYRFKCAIVVDEDVDIDDDAKVMWAVMTRTQADRSLFTVPGSYVSRVDPTGYSPWHTPEGDAVLSTRLGIDATKPLGQTFPEVGEPPRDLWTKVKISDYTGGK